MAWKKINKDVSHFLKWSLSKFSCCDLCGGKVGSVVLYGNTLDQSLLCQYCVDDLPYFNFELLNANLLSWPLIYRALPTIHFDYLLSLTPYINPVDHWLHQFKYQGRFELASLFSALLCNVMTSQWLTVSQKPDMVLSVPLHLSKWQVRGYNQAHLIAKKIATKMQLPYSPSLLLRMNKGSSQVGKTGAERRKNLRNAFALSSSLPQEIKHILLVDDVITTGSTASEISKLLKNAGVEKVTVVTVCLSLPKP